MGFDPYGKCDPALWATVKNSIDAIMENKADAFRSSVAGQIACGVPWGEANYRATTFLTDARELKCKMHRCGTQIQIYLDELELQSKLPLVE